VTKRVAIIQSNYIPWKGYFDLIAGVDTLILYDDVQYTRNDWRNRNKIKTTNGLLWLTIPVELSGKFGQKIRETKISSPAWVKKHWFSIQQSYARAAVFRDQKDWLESLYLNCSSPWLSEVNHHFLTAFCAFMNIRTEIRWSSEFHLEDDRNERLVSLCQQVRATEYWSGPAAKAYLDEVLFTNAGIAVKWMDYSGYPEYPQLFPPFEHGVSVVDLLLNVGQDVRKYMKFVPQANAEIPDKR
jgi:hypothetical protein